MTSQSGPGRRQRGIAAGAAAALLLSLAATTLGATPASAADTTACSPYLALYASDTAGKSWFWRGSTSNFGATLTSVPAQPLVGPVARELTGLTKYPTIFGSTLPNSTLAAFGVSADTTVRGLNYWNGGTTPTTLTNALAGFAGAAVKNKITADRYGNIFDIQYGALEQWTYDPSTTPGTWSKFSRTLATGWDAYDLIVATDYGVVYARKSNGDLYRWEVEPVSSRGLTGGQKVGTGFNRYKSMFSAGGNTLIGVLPGAGALEVSRWNVSTGAWAVQKTAVNVPNTTNFSGYANVWAEPRTCASPFTSTPVPTVTPERHAPVGVSERKTLDNQLKGVDFALVDDIGRLAVQHQPDQDGVTVDPAVFIAPGLAFTGKPQVWEVPYKDANDRRTSVMALQRTATVRQYVQSSGDWTTVGNNQGGLTKYPPVSVRLGTSWAAVFMTSADGKLFLSDSAWENKGGGAYSIRPNLLSWRDVALPAGVTLAGPVVATALNDTKAAVLARDTDGKLWEADYTATPLGVGPVSAWRSLGGTGFTGSPSAVAFPGGSVRVFARNADGLLVTQLQNADLTFPGTWAVVGPESQPATVGNPSAVLSYQGRSYVFVRDADGAIQGAQENGQACGSFQWWRVYDPNLGHPAVADPTAYQFTGTNGTQWGVASYDADFALIVAKQLAASPPAGGCASGSAASRAAGSRTSAGDTGGAVGRVTFPALTTQVYPPLPKP